jgi:CheY-like chemotaxis protein
VTESKLVLVVDDDADVREGLTRLLRSKGYAAVAAASGRSALELLRHMADKPALLIVDVRMPEMTGPDLVARLKEDAELRTIPVLMLSATLPPHLPRTCRAVPKTVSPSELLQIVAELVA